MADSEETADAKPAGKQGGGVFGLAVLAVGSFATTLATVFLLTPEGSASTAPCPTVTEATAPAPPAVDLNRDYVDLEELIVTIGSAPATRYLKMNIAVVTKKGNAGQVKDAQPVLIDAFVNYLRAVELEDFEDPGFYAEMREQLARRAELVLGGSVADGVLITEFLLR